MKALTLRQPFASLVADGRKLYETRAYAPPGALIGERVAIHASRRWTRDEKEAACDLFYCADYYGAGGRVDPPPMQLGVVACTARLVAAHHVMDTYPLGGDGVYRITTGLDSLGQEADPDCGPALGNLHTIPWDAYGDYAAGRWAWRLTYVEVLDPPVPARGRQGWWEWTP